MSSNNDNEAFLFIADLHSLTQIKDAEIVNLENLNFFSKFISKLSENNPLLYGSMAILLAILLGIIGAGGRQLLSKYKHVFLIKKN